MKLQRSIRTRIVCTIGPASSSPDMLEKLVVAGMDVARLNFSHGTQEEHGRVIAEIRRISARLGLSIAVMQDLAGLKIRTGPIADGPIDLEPGRAFTLTTRDVPGGADEVSVTYSGLTGDVSPGDVLLLSDGDLELVVETTTTEDILCRVTVGGPLSSHKGINLPARSITAPVLTDKDRSDLAYGLEHGVDYVALSFVRSADDVADARAALGERCRAVPLVAKIEKHEALVRIDEIVDVVDGVMVARGDLGVEIPVEQIPRIQKSLIRKGNIAGRPVITATQMLKSMVESPRPTRAEVTDVANAILDGSDAIMLSEETAVGRHPVAAVEMMVRIAADVEAGFPYATWSSRFGADRILSPEEAVAHSACRVAGEVEATAIVTLTQSGSSARLVAKYRPRVPVLAMTPSGATYRKLALVWGTTPILMEPAETYSETERQAVRLALASGVVSTGQKIVITAGVPLHVPGTTNLVKILTAEVL